MLVSVHVEGIPALVLGTLSGDANVVRMRLQVVLTSSSSAPTLII